MIKTIIATLKAKGKSILSTVSLPTFLCLYVPRICIYSECYDILACLGVLRKDLSLTVLVNTVAIINGFWWEIMDMMVLWVLI